MDAYDLYKKGSLVDVHDDSTGEFLISGTITKTGTTFATVVTEAGEGYDIPYPMMRTAGMKKQSTLETVKEEEKEGKSFKLVKEEVNKDGVLSVVYRVLVDDKPVSESEEIVMNVYDQEFGWSAPDDFDENKVDLLKSTFESGFDLLVESYKNIEQHIMDAANQPVATEAPAPPEGKPAFAPGTKPSAGAPAGGGDTGGAPEGAGDGEQDLSGGEAVTVNEETVSTSEEGGEAPAPEAPMETTSASLERKSFARSILAGKDEDQRLHGNPQHRINPLVRKQMEDRGIDSGNTNDLELADALETYDFGDPLPKK